MNTQGIPARRSALYLLEQIIGEGRLMSEVLGAGALDRLDPPDRARAQRLANDTLRGMERADTLIRRHVQKTPPLFVQNALRLGAVELAQNGAAHGVVNDLVNIVARHRHHGRLKGLANAVLRKLAGTAAAEWDSLRIPRLPKWLRAPLTEAWGSAGIAAMERAHFAGAPLDLTARSDPQAVAAATGGQVLPTGTVRLTGAGQVSALPGFNDGQWWVQDVAAALPAQILDPASGARVLDMCAAPGGKTLQLAARGAQVTALDISEHRAERIRQNLIRTGLQAEVVVGDALAADGLYDAVLLDAPCSATGTLRRHPDLPYAKDGSDFAGLIALQAQLLDKALSLLAPGGRMVFCTCSLLPDEGEVQIEEALDRHKTVRVDRSALRRPGIDPDWITEEGGLRLRPDYLRDLGGMDGFYIACLQRDT